MEVKLIGIDTEEGKLVFKYDYEKEEEVKAFVEKNLFQWVEVNKNV